MKESQKLLFPCLACIMLMLGFENAGFQLALYDIASEFQLGNAAMGWIVTAQFVAVLVMPLLFGGFSDRFGKKLTMLIFLPICVGGCILAMLSKTPSVFLCSVFVIGTGYGILLCLVSAAASDINLEKSKKNVALSQAFFGIGSIIGPFATAALADLFGSWRNLYLVFAIGLCAVLPTLLFSRFPAVQPRQKEGKIIKWPLLLAFFALAMFLYSCVENGFAFFADTFFVTQLDSPALGTYAISAFWLAMTLARFITGLYSTHSKRLIPTLYAVTAGLLFVFSAVYHEYLSLTLCFGTGMMLGPIWPMIVGTANRIYRPATGMVTSMLMGGAGLGAAMVPVIMGSAADFINYRFSIVLLAVFAIGASCIGVVLSRKEGNVK